MPSIGKINTLEVLKHVDFGVYLDGADLGEILLPLRWMKTESVVGEKIEVFLGYDSDDRLMATTETPLAQVGEFAHLKVVSLTPHGTFLNWGLSKDLFLPFSEQTRELKVGYSVVVFIYLDKSSRISASMRLDRHLDKTPPDYQENQIVDLMIASATDLGFKAVINGRHIGVIYQNEIFQKLEHGQKLSGFIKKVRSDGKIDLMLQLPQARKQDSGDISEKILNLLKVKDGFLPMTDKTSPETIYDLFGVSKKKYKIALGALYKKRSVRIEDAGIYLV